MKVKEFNDNESFFKFVEKNKDKINIRCVSIEKDYILVKYETINTNSIKCQ